MQIGCFRSHLGTGWYVIVLRKLFDIERWSTECDLTGNAPKAANKFRLVPTPQVFTSKFYFRHSPRYVSLGSVFTQFTLVIIYLFTFQKA